MAHYYFRFPEDTGLKYIQKVKAKDIYEAWRVMNYFFKRYVGYGYTITELINDGLYNPYWILPVLGIADIDTGKNKENE